MEVKAKKVDNVAKRRSDIDKTALVDMSFTNFSTREFLRVLVTYLNQYLLAVGKIVVKCNVKPSQQIQYNDY